MLVQWLIGSLVDFYLKNFVQFSMANAVPLYAVIFFVGTAVHTCHVELPEVSEQVVETSTRQQTILRRDQDDTYKKVFPLKSGLLNLNLCKTLANSPSLPFGHLSLIGREK